MFVAACAGLAGRIEEVFGACERWERESGKRLRCVFQLGDLPLAHDFSRLRQRGGPGAVAELVHGRRSPRYPLVFLAGEQDDPGLIARFSRESERSREPGQGDLRAIQGPGESSAGLILLPSGSTIRVSDEQERLLVGGLSLTRPAPEAAPRSARRGKAAAGADQAGSWRAVSRRLLQLPPGSLSILLSHDTPERLLESGLGEPEPGETDPGALFLKTLRKLQPRVAFHGHGLSGPRLTPYGPTLLCSLPPSPPSGGSPAIALLDTTRWKIVFLNS